jgi:hypothetical protein
LKALVEDPKRSWIGHRLPPPEYADGLRQYAYRVLRAKLDCRELATALDEIGAVTRLYRDPVPGVAPEQIARVRALNVKVQAELRAEHSSRCGT